MIWKQVILGLLIGVITGWWFKLIAHHPQRPIRAPSSRKIMSTVFYDKLTDQHYRFRPVTHVCPPSVDIDALEHSEDDDDND
jgi:hypothetical protein